MITYEINGSIGAPGVIDDDLWRLEFRAPVDDFDEVLCWVDNMDRVEAIAFERRWREGNPGLHIWCEHCPGAVQWPHEHDVLPEQRGWYYREMTHVRIMPMREAI